VLKTFSFGSPTRVTRNKRTAL